MSSSLNRTVLYPQHRQLGAKLVPFAGWEMPIQYKTGILEEHTAVRTRAGMFDVSHMGEIEVEGKDAERFLDYLTPSPVTRMKDGQAQYSFLCDETGGMIDDIIIYRHSPTSYLVCVNAANIDTDWHWIESHARNFDISVKNVSDQYALLALQGPLARSFVTEQLFPGEGIAEVKRFHFKKIVWNKLPVIAARTGYTGEDGFEFFCPTELAPLLWDQILEKGASVGIVPVGLGARDSLRLEAALPLYGHELDRSHSPVESGLSRFVDWQKENYIGKSRLEADRETGGREALIACHTTEQGIPREGYLIGHGEEIIGRVTSGGFSPTLQRGIALAFVRRELAQIGLDIWVEIRKKRVRAKSCEKPFYKPGSST